MDCLYCRTRDYFAVRGDGKTVNYEDLYFLASQLADDRTELQNPALLPFLEMLRHYSGADYADLAEETCNFIDDVISTELSKPAKSTQHLSLFQKVSQDSDMALAGIATLAHDTHVETFLKSHIELADGFGDASEGACFRVWENRFENTDSIPFMKLHGSVNWSRLDLRDPGGPTHSVGIRTCSHPECSMTPLARRRPLLLVGTFNKPAMYARGIMVDIHYKLRTLLDSTDVLVICGYSFGDKAINNHIIDSRVVRRPIVVIDPRPREDVIRTARYAAGRFLSVGSGPRHFIEAKLEEVSLKRLKGYILREECRI